MKISLLLFFVLFVVNCTSPTTAQSTSESQDSSFGESDPPVSSIEGFKVAVISDLNRSYGSTSYSKPVSQAIDLISSKKTQIDFVISTGDMVAGQKSNLDYAAMWESFHATVTRPLNRAQIPLLPSPGNHDAYVSRDVERQHYKRSWMREETNQFSTKVKLVEGVTQNFPFQYAFKRAGILFIGLDNTSASPWTEKTFSWLREVLKKEQKARIKVIFGHIPLLPFAVNKEREYVARGGVGFLNDVESLFEEYKVDVFLSGHSHVYYPGRRDAHTEYISVPLLGSGPRRLLSTEKLGVSERAFLVLEFPASGGWTVSHRSASGGHLIDDGQFPKDIRLPSNNSSLCKKCKEFPKTHFLDSKKRIIYKRRDL